MSLIVCDWRDLRKVEAELLANGVASASYAKLRDFMRMVRRGHVHGGCAHSQQGWARGSMPVRTSLASRRRHPALTSAALPLSVRLGSRPFAAPLS